MQDEHTNPEASPLQGLRLLICRPEGRGDALATRMLQLGAQVGLLPLLEIQPQPLSAEARSLIEQLDLYEQVIVVSPAAADFFLAAMDEWWPQCPLGIRWHAIGEGTAKKLRDAGLSVQTGQGHTSEELLTSADMQQIEGQRILLCKGSGGRQLIAATLLDRGARLDSLELYQRNSPDYSAEHIQQHLCQFDPQLIVALSAETLNNLLRLGQNVDQHLRQRALLLPAERVAETAQAAGFEQILVARALTTEALVTCIRDWFDDARTRFERLIS